MANRSLSDEPCLSLVPFVQLLVYETSNTQKVIEIVNAIFLSQDFFQPNLYDRTFEEIPNLYRKTQWNGFSHHAQPPCVPLQWNPSLQTMNKHN